MESSTGRKHLCKSVASVKGKRRWVRNTIIKSQILSCGGCIVNIYIRHCFLILSLQYIYRINTTTTSGTLNDVLHLSLLIFFSALNAPYLHGNYMKIHLCIYLEHILKNSVNDQSENVQILSNLYHILL